MTLTRFDLDDVVTVATIVETMLERPMTHSESSWPKAIYQRGDTLAGLAHIKEWRDQATKHCCPTTDPAPITYIMSGWG